MYNELITNPKENNQSSDAAKKLLSKIMNFAALDDSEKILKGEEVINFANTVAKDSASGISAALAKDITAMLTHPDKVVLDNKYIENLVKNIEVQFQGHKYLKNAIISFDDVLNALSPVKPQEGEQSKSKISDIKAAFNNNEPITKKQFELLLKDGVVVDKQRLTNAVINAVEHKIENIQFTNSGSISSEKVLKRVKQMAVNEINGNNIIPKSEKLIMTKDAALNIQKMAAPLAEYVTRLQQLREINDLKMGNIADSQNAFFWKKLEKAFTNIVFPNNVITSKSFKTLVDNTDDIEKAARKNLEKLVRDEELYKKAIKEIDAIKMAYLKEIFGNNEAQYVQYNDFIKGSNQLNGVNWNVRTYSAYGTEIDKFIELQTKLANNFNANVPQETPFKNLMKVLINRPRDNAYNYTVAYHEVEENVKKIENFVTACDRIIHSMDIYRRAHLGEIAPDKKPIEAEMFNQAKHNVIGAMSTDFFSKFNNRNRPLVFKDYMNLIYCENGYLDNATKQALQKESRYTVEGWIDKTRRLLFNDHANWQYSEFTNNNVFLKPYDDALLSSPNARFRAEGKNPIEFLNQGIKNSYNSNKWLRMFGGLFIGVFSLSIIAQFFFGKKDSTIPLEKDRIARLKQESLEKQNADNNLKPENEIEEEAANAN